MSSSKKLTKLLFIVYLIALTWIIVFKDTIPFTEMGHMRNINLEPFQAPSRINGQIDYSEMIMNIVIFIPYGIYAGMLLKKWHLIQKIQLFFVTSLFFEMTQYILAVGASDITDIINNTQGGIVGLIIFWLLNKFIRNKIRIHKFINVFAFIGTVSMVVLLLIIFLYL